MVDIDYAETRQCVSEYIEPREVVKVSRRPSLDSQSTDHGTGSKDFECSRVYVSGCELGENTWVYGKTPDDGRPPMLNSRLLGEELEPVFKRVLGLALSKYLQVEGMPAKHVRIEVEPSR
jgi:hypothetical protein